MKSIIEIEERIGFSLEYDKWSEYAEFTYEVVKHRELNQRSKEAVENLLVESLNVGDMETASLCGYILNEASLDKQEIEELRSAEDERVGQILADIDSLDENASIEDIEELLENIKLSKSACSHIDDETKKRIEDKRQGLDTVLQQKVKDKISSLDEQIADLQEHIEIPENEDKVNELQQQIESLEGKYYEDNVRDSHKARRIAEQGIDMSEIMQNISEYRIYGKSYIDDENFDRLNAQIVKKTEFLERKLAFLQEYKDIPGNAERIAELESQIETMQDSWIVAQKGYNNMEEILQTAESKKNEIQNRLVQSKKEIETIDPMNRKYIQKGKQIENLTKQVTEYEIYIDRMQQTKTEIESGENPSFMGKHHINRLQREEQERVETNRGKIQDLEGQIAELQEHIEIPENEQKIINLQAQIDEIEATIPSDRENHKRARLQEQGRDTETIMTDIDDIIARAYEPYIEGKAERIDTEIKTRAAYLENKMNYLQQHLDIVGNEERVAELQSQIEQLEDKWELCTQGFGSKEQLEGRIRITKAHLYTPLMSFEVNKELELTPEQMQEYWNKIQNGEEVPELFGQHHRERVEREEQARIKAEQETEVNEQPEMTSTEELTNNEEKAEHLESLSDDKKETLEINEELQQDEEEKETKVTEEVKEQVTKYVTDTENEIKNIKKDKQAYLEYVETEKEKYEELKANVESMEPDDVTYEDEKNKLEDMEFQLKNMDERLNDFDNRIATKTSELQKVKEKYKGQIDFPKVNDIATEEQIKENIVKEEQEEIIDGRFNQEEVNDITNEEQIIEDTNINRRTTVIQDEQVYYDDNYSPQYTDYNENYDVSQKDMNEDPATQANLTVDKWMNRFSKWSSALEKVVQNVKYELVKIKADIVKVISEKLNERSNIRQNNTKEQDENER